MAKYFTNAPIRYDYLDTYHGGTIKQGTIRIIHLTEEQASFQIPRNASGLYWTTQDKDEAFSLSEFAPYQGD